ncbi:hypothetical protein Tco_0768517, partial [Tanacetum coccineum]
MNPQWKSFVEKFRDGGFKDVYVAPALQNALEDHSPVLLEFLSGYDNITHFLPKKFVSDLLRKRKNEKLNLDPEVVAEAFISIDDPLLILSSENVSPEIDAPCAIFAELDMNKIVLFTAFAALKVCSPKDATLVHNANERLQQLSFAFDPSRDEVKYLLMWKTLELALNKLQSYKRKIHKLLNRSVMSQVLKAEQTCESVVVENQSDYDNTQDGTNKKGKGNKGQKSKKSK